MPPARRSRSSSARKALEDKKPAPSTTHLTTDAIGRILSPRRPPELKEGKR
jgi:hypothetical protein